MNPILHHYPPSLFSEKIRVMFGYLNMDWHSVIIPPIMPRPLLMPLSGGYRKTPIMQIGADVYCDTAVIARKLASLAGDEQLFGQGFVADRVAQWADTELFRTVVTLNFREEAIAAQMSAMSAAEMTAFQEDRAQLSGGAPIVSMTPTAAEAHFQTYLGSLADSLSADFLMGSAPCVADFSVYHCLWFVAGNPANQNLLEKWPAVQAYMQRMASFGHGNAEDMDAQEAFDVALNGTPEPTSGAVDALLANGLQQGASVSVQATDYGRNPIAGELLGWSSDEITIRRQDEQVGEIVVHFPNLGFAVAAA